ncbi:50S ribosomal protein L11 methyltransferase [Tumebacillus permanentifrigoris]|uniref:[LSU ribosomal protein L11P]-lysine N-methyltransferase n=1 Tax=Tumebacillus permanentifrigoris TaxID=378543 RepID=A0A316D6V3_9BACL|nr:50S ribosomal protein L11 methyltransferase [Tumebacillus permanentifrigoris]PWK05046.1 [LSU ribosomal protein L11P]-lysine N-methyltransferase [Tumebacillus permanentifrigoris]
MNDNTDQLEPRYVEYAMQVDAARTEEAIARLQGRGIEYVWEEAPIETFVTPDGYGFQEAEVEQVTIRAYEESTEELTVDLLSSLCTELASWMGDLAHTVEATIPQAVTEDPVYQFTAIEVKPDLVIRPPWDVERRPDERTILIEPAAAFGTGEHPTTRHCLELLDGLLHTGDAFADLGAGSGILSVFARMKGAGVVLAVDLNPSAESAIQYLMELNGVEGIDVRIADVFAEFAQTQHHFDLVAVNIGGQEAIDLAELCLRILKPDGTLLLSGIVEWIEQQVVDAYLERRWQVTSRLQGDEWVTLAVKKTT